MELYQNLGNFLDNYGSPFFVGSLVEKKLLFVNKEAKRVFDCTEETCDFEKIFERTEERLESLIEKGLQTGKNSIFYNFIVKTGKQEKIVVDFQFGFFNDEKTEMFLEILPQQDTRLQMAKNQIQNSPRAEAILNFDENLSIVDCNEAFYKVFECNEELCHSHCKHQLMNGFPTETRESLMAKIQETLKKSEIFSTEIKVLTADGEAKWYRFDLQKRELDSTGTKLMCYMVDIEKQVELKEENYQFIKQLSASLKLTDDILYRIDVLSKTLVYTKKSKSGEIITNTLENYPQSAIDSNLVHPEDEKIILEQTEEWISGNMQEYKLRMKIVTEEYEWYEDSAINICDKEGRLTEIYGRLKNIHATETMKTDFSTLDKPFSLMQEVSDDYLFRIDILENTFYHSNGVADGIGIMSKTENYVETFIANGNIHPDDVEHYRICNEKLKLGELTQYEMRAEIEKGVYHAFDVKCNVTYSNTGEPIEIFGCMKDIQERKDLEARASHDLMTQVLNKVAFEDTATTVIANNEQGLSHAIIFIDLDDFKGINDNFGHDFGDFLLTTVGKRLKRVVRETDLIGRLGGDEFAVMLKSIGTPEAATSRVKLILDTLQRPFSFEGKTMEIKASIGFAIAPLHGNDYKKLIKKADMALYQSKGKGKNTATMYTEEIEEY